MSDHGRLLVLPYSWGSYSSLEYPACCCGANTQHCSRGQASSSARTRNFSLNIHYCLMSWIYYSLAVRTWHLILASPCCHQHY